MIIRLHNEAEQDITSAAEFYEKQSEGGRNVKRNRKFYNLDAVISVGYRVNSVNATRFRQWANQVLKEYLTRGYAINEKRLKEQQAKMSDLRNTVALLGKRDCKSNCVNISTS